MSDNEFPDYLRKAIEDGEVILDEGAKTARINIDMDAFEAGAGPERAAGEILVNIHRNQGLKARLEYLGYTVES
jgi:hypothetical protein